MEIYNLMRILMEMNKTLHFNLYTFSKTISKIRMTKPILIFTSPPQVILKKYKNTLNFFKKT